MVYLLMKNKWLAYWWITDVYHVQTMAIFIELNIRPWEKGIKDKVGFRSNVYCYRYIHRMMWLSRKAILNFLCFVLFLSGFFSRIIIFHLLILYGYCLYSHQPESVCVSLLILWSIKLFCCIVNLKCNVLKTN